MLQRSNEFDDNTKKRRILNMCMEHSNTTSILSVVHGGGPLGLLWSLWYITTGPSLKKLSLPNQNLPKTPSTSYLSYNHFFFLFDVVTVLFVWGTATSWQNCPLLYPCCSATINVILSWVEFNTTDRGRQLGLFNDNNNVLLFVTRFTIRRKKASFSSFSKREVLSFFNNF